MSKPRTLTLKTRQGSRRLAILFAALILLFGFAARMVETHNGVVKIEDVTIDAHGAQLSCRLYYPAYTDHNDKLPAVLTVHGYVCNGGVTKGIAEEIAKRGFVVLNVSGYGTGMSEMPEIDASGHGRYAQMGFGTDTGMYDALNFVRSLQFVDTTRIGMVGHSMGSARTDSTALLDCTFLTVNDQKLNILHNTFGVEIAEGELYADADTITQAKLNPDQLTYYQHLCEERKAKIKKILRGYDRFTAPIRQELADLGFEITEEGKHYKLTYYGDPRYWTTVAKTPSDNRAGDNDALTISGNMF